MTHRRLARAGLALLLCVLLGCVAVLLSPRPELYAGIDFSTAVLDRDGRLLRLALAADERYRLFTPLDEVAPIAVDATLLYEDRWYRHHVGVNPAAVLRAAWSTWAARERPIGASTVTMQLARLRFGLQTRSLRGKLLQMARALQLERHYSKDELLEAYLNLAPYGGNVEGIGTAALVYFDKPATELTATEALALAVVPQNPVRRNPASDTGYAGMHDARRRLSAIAIGEGLVPAAQRLQFALPLAVRRPAELPFRAPHFSRRIAAGSQGLTTTTLDLERQRTLEAVVGRYVDRRSGDGIRNASAMLVDWRTMDVLAVAGSAGFGNDAIDGQVDGTAARRSPGSTLKPFVYGLAIDAGLIHPSSLLRDAPLRFAAYTPENFDRGFMGPVLARDALVYSRNVPAIELLAAVGLQRFHVFLDDAGIAGLQSAGHYGLAAVLGGNELSMRELVRLYAMLANGGRLRALRERLAEPVPKATAQLLSPEAGFLVLDMLAGNPRPGTAAGAVDDVAWKTGTSYAYRDAWSVGISGQYVLAVWVGNFDGSSNPAFVGRDAAAPLFFEIVDALRDDTIEPPWRNPQGLNVARVDVCQATGDLPGRYCPATTEDWFIPGVSPIRTSDVYRRIAIDADSGRRSCDPGAADLRYEVFEFWPSDILDLYSRAGVSVRRPPPWADGCRLAARHVQGRSPTIRSPAAALTYVSRVDDDRRNAIPLQAVTDADARRLYWFLGDRFVATTAPGGTAFWEATPGRYELRAVDDLGRSATQTVRVRAAR